MTTQEMKQTVHSYIDEIDNNQFLEDLYTVLKEFRGSKSEIDFWDQLTTAQKQELEESLEQSEHEEMLINHNIVMEEAKGWIKK